MAILQHADLTSSTLDFSDTMYRLQQCTLPPAEVILISANQFRWMELRRMMNEQTGNHQDGPRNRTKKQARHVSPARRRFTAISEFANSAATAISILRRDILDSMESVDPMEEMRRRTPQTPRSPTAKSVRIPKTPPSISPTPTPTPDKLSVSEEISIPDDIPNPITPTSHLAD